MRHGARRCRQRNPSHAEGDRERSAWCLGTGAAGLVAALAAHEHGASVGLFEKGDVVGGTTALSGGIVWIPNNPHAAAAGLADSREDALAYLDSLSLGMIDPEMAADARRHRPRRRASGSRRRLPCGSRSSGATPTTTRSTRVGSRPVDDPSIPACSTTSSSASGQTGSPGRRSVPRLQLLEIPLGGGSGTIDPAVQEERDRHDARGRGHALVGALLAACLERGIEPVTGARANELVRDDGRVTGVRFDSGAPLPEVDARRGVVLATGGFEWDAELVKTFLRGPMTSPTTIPTNTGDGLRMALGAGAALGMMGEAWWVPTAEIPGEELYGRPAGPADPARAHAARARSWSIARAGASPTRRPTTTPSAVRCTSSIRPASTTPTSPAGWSSTVRTSGGTASSTPHQALPRPSWVIGGADARRTGRDGRHRRRRTRHHGRPLERARRQGARRRLRSGRQRLRRMVRRPALPRLAAGDDRTTARAPVPRRRDPQRNARDEGWRTDEPDAQVLDFDGRPIAGLYAAGNAMAAPTGMVYGGGGGTIGPAIVFGYRAGRHAATVR